ncbi:MAG: UvrD-helicase domain-containing protein [Spirochaetaceae bacterium]|jgi:DNA helicase-2/ATP-dependent DNA helicase PcrA|nr:UvrD-helicase domain-containing protein [Spirochaetaceae bacterium]
MEFDTNVDVETGLNPPQLQAVKTIEGPVLIIAGAGSGKTRVITYRIVHMLQKGIPQSAILALTFTNKAAREMGNRIKELTKKKLQSLTVSTFHAFGVEILRKEIEQLGYRKNFSIYDEADKIQAVKEALSECKMLGATTDIKTIATLFSNIKIERLSWGEGANPDFERVFNEYNSLLKVYNAVDFDDLLVLPIKLFTEHPEILKKYRERFNYIMVDEFQDTSLIQYRLLKMLAGKNVCVVGDDDQSIYSWRGANYENIINFEKDFPGLTEIKLEQNYRSTTTILEAANGVIAHNSNRKDKKLWSPKSGGKAIKLFFPQNESEEADFIAEQINTIRFEEHLKYDSFGILLRNNSLMDRIEESLLAENIPYRVSGGTSFFARSEIKDVLSYLRCIANGNDDVNLLRVINTPRRGIGKTTIRDISNTAKKNRSSLWDAMKKMRYAQDALFDFTDETEIDDFIKLLDAQREAFFQKGELSKKVSNLVDTIDYWSYLVTEYSKNEKLARWKFINIQRLIESIETWEKNPDTLDTSLYAYLNRISLLTRDEGEDESDKGKVNLMTIHASKGLEFPVVFIAGCEDGIIPNARSLEESEDNIEEERRLFYVALTRARDKLIITSCLQRKKRGKACEGAPSSFLAEIPGNLVEVHNQDGDQK